MDKPVGYCIEEMITKLMDADSTSIPETRFYLTLYLLQRVKKILSLHLHLVVLGQMVFFNKERQTLKLVARYAVYLENVKVEDEEG